MTLIITNMSKIAENKKLNQIRYNLHHEVRKEGFDLNTRKRTIYVYFENVKLSKAILRLRSEFNYAVQTELDNPKQTL